MDLPLDDHRVDQLAAVVDDGVLEDRDLGRVRIGLDDRRVHAGGEGRALGRVEVRALQPGLLVLGHRRLAGVADGELRGRLGGLVEGVAQRVRQHRDRAEVDRRTGHPLHRDDAVDDLEVGGVGLEGVGGDRQRLLLGPPGGQVDRRPAHHGRPGGEGADGVRHPAGVTRDHLHVLEAAAELVGDQLGEDGRVPLALGGQPGGDLDLARGLDVDVGPLVGADPGAFDVAGQTDADPAPDRRHRRLERREVVPADERFDLLQRGGVVAGVVLQLAAVLEDQPLVVGELVRLDEVGRAHQRAVPTEVGGDRVHRPLHHEAALRPAGTAVGGDHRGVGVERLEAHPVDVGLVGPEQLCGGDDRHDQAVGRVGAVVVPELHVQPEQAPVVVEADLDVVHLAALMGRGDEVLATVLGELHDPAEGAGRERHQELLGPGVVDLDAEAAAHVGGDHVDLAQVEPELDRDGGPHPRRGLRRGPHLEPVGVGVPPGDGAAALHRGARRAFDGEIEGQPVRGGGQGRLDVAGALLHPGADVARDVVVHEAVRRTGRLDPHDGRQHVVGHDDATDGVLGDIAVVGDHERDRLADVVDLVAGQRVLRAAVGQRRVRDQQRQRIGHRGREPAEVLVGPDQVDAVEVEHGVDVDVDDARVGVG
ncbi:unannotated protein [freshwater metagenome]|uniref:Unannotated protein n=1 Tax=freshwater metagenome TaxID=449393 RepID=A0A6J6QY52_9ZZZZ